MVVVSTAVAGCCKEATRIANMSNLGGMHRCGLEVLVEPKLSIKNWDENSSSQHGWCLEGKVVRLANLMVQLWTFLTSRKHIHIAARVELWH